MSEFHLTWLFGDTLRAVETHEFDRWSFVFQTGGSIHVECPWRLLQETSILISSSDHGQKYGLAAPLNAASQVLTHLSGRRVESVVVLGGTCDIFIKFAPLFELQILPFSTGFEAWQAFSPAGYQVIAQGGGQLRGIAP